ncbi:MAG: hypothetical protein KBA71_03595 [Opitutaceae bacterium]|nr:hypothetical protein [Opitutaceae bacterium]
MKSIFLFAGILLCAASAAAGPDGRVFSLFPGAENIGKWEPWTPRAEISPKFSIDEHGGRNGGRALRIESRSIAEVGGWQLTLNRIQPGRTYRFAAWYHGERIANQPRSVIARLAWLDATGRPFRRGVHPPEYPVATTSESGWTRLELTVPAPESATGLDIQLILGFAPDATLWWDDVTVTEVAPPVARSVRVTTVHLRPRGAASHAESVEQFCALLEKTAADKPDIVCLPEGITLVGTGGSFANAAEPVPGPTTARLGRLARKLGSYIVAGIYERADSVIYDTAVLIGRDGALVGRYRKTHLPTEEWERGLTPGDSYPVFDTDFGRIGLLVCWDARFPEPCRSMAAQGAKMILLPTWGGSDLLARARAMENHVFLVSAGYDMRSLIIGPAGEVLAEATAAGPAVTREIFPDRKVYEFWVGDMGPRTWKERRGELPPAAPK